MSGLSASLHRFIACSSASSLADPCIRFGVSWYVLQSTGSAGLFATVYGLAMLADGFSRPLLAPLADHFDRLIVFKLSAALAMCVSLVLALSIAFMAPSAVLLGALLVALGLVTGLREPTTAALTSELAEPAELGHAQSVQLSVNSATSTFAPAVAGALVALVGPVAALAVAVLLEAAGWLGACFIRRPARAPGAPASPPTWASYVATLVPRTLEGLTCLWRAKAERKAIVAAAFTNTAVVILLTLVLPVWVSRDLQGTPALMAALEMAFGVGLLLGSALLVSPLNRRIGRHRAVVLGPAMGAVGLLAAAASSSPVVLGSLVALLGLGLPLLLVNCGTLRALATPDAYRARLMGAAGFIASGLMPLAVPGVGVVLARFPASVAVLLCALLLATSAVLLARNRVLQQLLQLPEEQMVNEYQRLYPRAFGDVEVPRS